MIAMGGVLQTKASLDVSFVIVKNVLAAKYKVFIIRFSFSSLNWKFETTPQVHMDPLPAKEKEKSN